MSVDLKQFYQVFFEESLEGLDIMEQSLLEVSNQSDTDPELINTIFRAAHSIKGGSATLGFEAIAGFTHVLETLLDEVRDGKRQLTSEAIDLLLKSCDALRAMIHCLEREEEIDETESKPLVTAFERMLGQEPSQQAEQSSSSDAMESQSSAIENTFFAEGTEASSDAAGPRTWLINFIPEPQILLTGNEPLRLFRELKQLGEMSITANTEKVPHFEQMSVDECFLSWQITLTTEQDVEEIRAIFDWVLDECQLEITPQADHRQATSSQTTAEVVPEQPSAQPTIEPEPTPEPVTEAKTPVVKKPADNKSSQAPASGANSSIRVGIDKVDNLINLVGELVITQSMLSELGNEFELEKLERLAQGLEQLRQNTRELQESVMRIRMLPISFAFNRFPRMIRDLSMRTGKKVELVVKGEQTELDKTVMEQIGDPLVHLVRNAVDHGLEMPEDRAAAGKEETGTITLSAEHKGGNIVIEISDDGRGMSPDAIFKKAIEKGVVTEDQELTEQEILELIFEPGFSTAAQVSDLSGRGVGMDVVRRNIKALGGRIELESTLGSGSTIRVHLPLTLAILDGQLVRVGSEVYIIPLVAIVESLQVKQDLINKVSGDLVMYRLREDNVPIVPVHKEFCIEADNTELNDALLVVVESGGTKIGLMVDDLLAQQQVVIKSLESNYRSVEGISGATILGDGSVALILDIPGLINSTSSNRRKLSANKAA